MLVGGRKARLLGMLQFFVYSQLSLCCIEPETAAALCEEDWTWLIKVWSWHTLRYVTDAAGCWQNTESLMMEVLQCVCDCGHWKYKNKMYKATGKSEDQRSEVGRPAQGSRKITVDLPDLVLDLISVQGWALWLCVPSYWWRWEWSCYCWKYLEVSEEKPNRYYCKHCLQRFCCWLSRKWVPPVQFDSESFFTVLLGYDYC